MALGCQMHDLEIRLWTAHGRDELHPIGKEN